MRDRQFGVVFCGAAFALLVCCGGAQAQDHPVLLDGTWVGADSISSIPGKAPGQKGAAQASTTIIGQAAGLSVSSHTFGGYLDHNGSSSHVSARVFFLMYEPDFIQRSGESNELRQSSHLAYMLDFATDGFRLGGAQSISQSGIAPSCSGRIRLEEPGAVPDEAPMAYRVKCTDLDADLGLTANQAAALKNYFKGMATGNGGSKMKWPKKFQASDPIASF